MRSSTPLKKEISAAAVLITQLGSAVYWLEWNEEISIGRGSSLTGTIVNLFVGIRMAPPLIDTFIVPEVPGYLYALFDYGLTSLITSLTTATRASFNSYIVTSSGCFASSLA